MSYLDSVVLNSMGFKSVGAHCRISSKAAFYGIENIVLGDHVRIDDFCVISGVDGNIEIGNYVHIAAHCLLYGGGGIFIGNYAGVSSRSCIYSSNDDYSGEYMTGPCVPSELSNVTKGRVDIGKHTVIGTACTVLPNVSIGAGSALGAHSLVTSNLPDSVIAVGVPAKVIRPRATQIFELEKRISDNWK
jgi:acetyltransferase-like isoleucine patch superfamily enzyme